MVCACFSYSSVGPISLIDAIMDQHVYVNILRNVILSYTDDEMSLIWTFQQNNDSKHEDVAQFASRPRNARYSSYLFRHINNQPDMGTSDVPPTSWPPGHTSNWLPNKLKVLRKQQPQMAGRKRVRNGEQYNLISVRLLAFL